MEGGQYLRLNWLGEARLTDLRAWYGWYSPLKGAWGQGAVVSVGLLKPQRQAPLAQLCYEEILFTCSKEDSDLEAGTRFMGTWASK